MDNKVLELFVDDEKLSFKTIKKKLGISNQHKDEELEKVLKKLELDGLIYYDTDKDIYQNFPSNFLIAEINFSNKGNPFIILDDSHINLFWENVDGALNFDTIIFERIDNVYYVKKILKRLLNQVVCEVCFDENNSKYLKVHNQKNLVKVSIGTKALKKLTEGELVLVKIGTDKYDDYYIGEYIKRIGHINNLDDELKSIAYNNGFEPEYPELVMEEIENIPDEVQESDYEGRVDKTKDRIFTIDGDNTKDIDDALEISQLENGNFLLKVSIAHVSHYVKQGSALWDFAQRNTTSLYLVDSVLAMLHTKLSNGICSLNPDVDRLARTFEMEINPYGDIINYKTYKSVIHSKKKMTYDNVNKILEDNIIPDGYEDFVEDLKLLEKFSNIITTRRQADGAIDFNNNEITFKVDDEENIERSQNYQKTAEKIVENAMIVTGYSTGRYFEQLSLPFVFRNHEFPREEKLKETYRLIKSLGYKIDHVKDIDDPKIVQKIVNSLSKKEEFVVLSVLILKSLQRAYFSKDNHGHYGLALDFYSQVTSPIRRFLDLVIHTLIDYYDNWELSIDNLSKIEKYLDDICPYASHMERCADKAEYESDLLYMVKSLQQNVGDEFYGFIYDINPSYIVVKTTDLIDGVCYYDLRGTDFRFHPESKQIYNKVTKQSIRIGNKVHLRLAEAALDSRQIKFEIMDFDQEPALIRTRI